MSQGPEVHEGWSITLKTVIRITSTTSFISISFATLTPNLLFFVVVVHISVEALFVALHKPCPIKSRGVLSFLSAILHVFKVSLPSSKVPASPSCMLHFYLRVLSASPCIF